MIRRAIRGFALWLLRTFCQHQWEYVALPPKIVMDEARRLTLEAQQKFPDASGEFKRAQVYRALQNIFPQQPHRALGKAIELVLK